MLVKFLRGGELGVADGALGAGTWTAGRGTLSRSRGARDKFTAVGRCLLDIVDGGQVALENVRAVERLLVRGTWPWAEWADHGALVMGQGVAVLVVFPGETFGVVLAGFDGTLLRSLLHVCQHVSGEVFEHPSALRVWASVPIWRVYIFWSIACDVGER